MLPKCWTLPARPTCRARRSGSSAPSRRRWRACVQWTWSIGSRGDTDGVAGSASRGRNRGCRRRLPFGDLPVEVYQVASEQAGDLSRSGGDVREGAGWHQLGVAGHGELAFEPEERALGGEVGLLLLGCGRAREPVGDVGADGEGREHHVVGHGFGFAADVGAEGADDVACQADGFLPDSELSQAGRHGNDFRPVSCWRVTYSRQGGPEACRKGESCFRTGLVIIFTSCTAPRTC